MALVGEMQYLTIGGNTYSIAAGGITTETDPVFSASAAAGITDTDINNWNSKVSDDKTWNGIVLNKSMTLSGQDLFFPSINNASTGTESYFVRGTSTPTQYALAKYDANSYLYSITPSANDNSTKVATTAYVDSAIDALPEPMIFKGSVGTGGTVTSLPTAAAENEGWTYKVITALSSPAAKVGDTVISNGSSWIVIPSGDEPSGTVTSVGISNGGGLSVSGSPITSSGTITISHADTSSQASSSNSGRTYIQSLTLDGYGHVTGISTATETVTNTDEKVKTTKASYDSSEYGIVVGSINATTEVKKVISGFAVTPSNSNEIYLWLGTDNIKGNLCLANNSHYTYLKPSATTQRTITLPDKTGTVALTSDIPDISGFITSETDPVFSASAAAGITATDISNWNAKVSDDKTWNGVELDKTAAFNTTIYIPFVSTLSDTTAHYIKAQSSPLSNRIPLYDYNAYLYSTTPSANDNSKKVATTAYVDSAIPTVPSNIVNTITTTAGAHTVVSSQKGNVSFNVPTKTSHLTNDSGFITSDSDEKLRTEILDGSLMYLIGGGDDSIASIKYIHKGLSYQMTSNTGILGIGSNTNGYKGAIRLYGSTSNTRIHIQHEATANRTITLPDKTGTIALTSDIPDVSGFITSETDPVFSASAAAGITATDISNWNAKVSDDKTWNGVSLDKQTVKRDQYYLPSLYTTTASKAELCQATTTPTSRQIAMYDANAYLKSTTPSANDNSTKVATTAYVDSAIPAIPSKVGDMPVDYFGAITGQAVTDKSIASGTSWGEFTNITLPDGVWIINIVTQFPTNATGTRMTTLSESSATAGTLTRTVRTSAQSGTFTTHHITTFCNGGTYYINVMQNSGSALTCLCRYTAVKIGSSLGTNLDS